VFLVEVRCRAFWPMTTTMRLISLTPNRGSQRPSLKVKNAGALHPSKLRQVTTPLPRGAVNRKRPFSKRGTTATHFAAAVTSSGIPLGGSGAIRGAPWWHHPHTLPSHFELRLPQ